MEPAIISPNVLKVFNSCPMKYFYKYVEQISNPVLDKGFISGKNIHALASYYLRGEDISKFERALTSMEKEYWERLKNCRYYQYDIVGVEKNITCRLGDFWIGGRLDAIVKSRNDYYILDYKTGGVSGDMTYDTQTMVYCLLCDEYYKNYDKLSFVYLDLKNNKDVIVEFSEKLKSEYITKLSDICSKIEHFNPSKFSKSQNCECEYSKMCKL